MKTDKHQSCKVVNDTSLYDGPSKSQVYDSFVDLYSDLISDLDPFLNRASLSLISNWISKFLNGFWKQSRSARTGQEVKDLADHCKERRNDLQSVISSFISGKAPAFPGDFYVVSDNPRKLESLSYYPNSFKALLSYMEELQEIMSFVELKQSPGFYVYLHKITFHLISSFDISEEEYEQNKEKIIILLNLALSLGQVYEHMNPTPEVMEEYGQALLNQLRQESKDPSDDFWSLFNEVAKDINAPMTKSNRYVHDIIRARRKFRKHGIRKYSYSDYYLTAKAATCTVTVNKSERIRLNALYSSIVEDDPIKDDPRVMAFDKLIGYQSGYIDQYDLPDYIDKEEKLVITQMIPNPGKFKPRGIHIGCNSIQDRCKYLHKVSAEFLNTIDSCCMKQHFNGVKFLKKVTSPSYRSEHRNNVFVSDFSNATDTLNQQFQCKVIEVLFNKTFADFWEFISTLPKTFRHPLDNSLEDYIQNTGQPQGLLNSFDAFSDAHIFLICMLMKRFNLTDVELSDVLAIVGDDSIVSYPCELELNEVEGYTFYTFHSWLCEQVSLIKNDSKTGKSFFDEQGNYSHEVLDFAKVSIQDGVFVTPIPYGLASAYANKPGFTDIQLYLWLSSKDIVYKELVYRRIFKFFYNKPDQLMAVTSVMSSGEIPFLKNFQDLDLFNSIDSTIRGVSLYAFYINQLEHTFLNSILSENRKDEMSGPAFLDKSLDSLEEDFYKFNSNLGNLIGILPKNHKYNLMIEKNMQIAQDLSDLLELGKDREDLSTLLGVLITDEYAQLFEYALRFHNQIVEAIQNDKQDIWQLFCYQDFSIFKELSDPLKNFQVKSMKKASSNSVTFMKSSAWKTHRIIQQSSYLGDCFTDCVSNFIDTLLQVAKIHE